jgi:penicillin-binding protein 1C
VLAAEGEGVSWYVDGAPVNPDPLTGKTVWRPAAAGFYRLEVIDQAGRKTTAQVRVKLD